MTFHVQNRVDKTKRKNKNATEIINDNCVPNEAMLYHYYSKCQQFLSTISEASVKYKH